MKRVVSQASLIGRSLRNSGSHRFQSNYMAAPAFEKACAAENKFVYNDKFDEAKNKQILQNEEKYKNRPNNEKVDICSVRAVYTGLNANSLNITNQLCETLKIDTNVLMKDASPEVKELVLKLSLTREFIKYKAQTIIFDRVPDTKKSIEDRQNEIFNKGKQTISESNSDVPPKKKKLKYNEPGFEEQTQELLKKYDSLSVGEVIGKVFRTGGEDIVVQQVAEFANDFAQQMHKDKATISEAIERLTPADIQKVAKKDYKSIVIELRSFVNEYDSHLTTIPLIKQFKRSQDLTTNKSEKIAPTSSVNKGGGIGI